MASGASNFSALKGGKVRKQRTKKVKKTKKAARPQNFKEAFAAGREKAWQKKVKRREETKNPHQSFRRSYREDYYRPLDVPGLSAHAYNSFKIIFQNWKTFLCLLIFGVVAGGCLVGLMSEETYVTLQDSLDESETTIAGAEVGNFTRAVVLLVSTVSTGGLSTSSESATLFIGILLLIVWLVSIYLVRHFLAGQKIKFRDALYNAGAPIVSTLAILLLIILQAVPILIAIVVYSAAISSGFLETPFYALLVFVFALAMVTLSAYLVPSSFIALAAATAPGLYPMAAVRASNTLMQGRRLRLVLRVVFLLLVVALIWFVLMVPIIMIDMWAKSNWAWLEGWPVVSIMLLVVTCFTFIYSSVYIYLFYREVLASDMRFEQREAESSAARLRAERRADDVELIHAVDEETTSARKAKSATAATKAKNKGRKNGKK